MKTIEFDFSEEISLNDAVEYLQEDKFLKMKLKRLGLEQVSEQKRIFRDYRDLMVCAIQKNFKAGDWKRLRWYLDCDSPAIRIMGDNRLYIPIQEKRDKDGEIEEYTVNREAMDTEINRYLFGIVGGIVGGSVDIRQCQAEGCDVVFVPIRGTQKFHNQSCRNKHNMKLKHRRRMLKK